MSGIIYLVIGIAIGAAIPETVRAFWKRVHLKAKNALQVEDRKKVEKE
jgi:hypothetical protein